jgi:hypothetical protein
LPLQPEKKPFAIKSKEHHALVFDLPLPDHRSIMAVSLNATTIVKLKKIQIPSKFTTFHCQTI